MLVARKERLVEEEEEEEDEEERDAALFSSEASETKGKEKIDNSVGKNWKESEGNRRRTNKNRSW